MILNVKELPIGGSDVDFGTPALNFLDANFDGDQLKIVVFRQEIAALKPGAQFRHRAIFRLKRPENSAKIGTISQLKDYTENQIIRYLGCVESNVESFFSPEAARIAAHYDIASLANWMDCTGQQHDMTLKAIALDFLFGQLMVHPYVQVMRLTSNTDVDNIQIFFNPVFDSYFSICLEYQMTRPEIELVGGGEISRIIYM